jgi:hypothetical protein
MEQLVTLVRQNVIWNLLGDDPGRLAVGNRTILLYLSSSPAIQQNIEAFVPIAAPI